MKNLKAIHEEAKKKYKVLGNGSTRTTYDMGDTVLKVLKHKDKPAQNKREIEMSREKAILESGICARVIDYDTNHLWLIMEKGDPVRKPVLASHMCGMRSRQVQNWIRNRAVSTESKDFLKDFQKSEIGLAMLRIREAGILIKDISGNRNWALFDGKVKIVDMGMFRYRRKRKQ